MCACGLLFYGDVAHISVDVNVQGQRREDDDEDDDGTCHTSS